MKTSLSLLFFMSIVCMGALTKPKPTMIDIAHWRVDANISGGNPSLGTSGVSNYAGLEHGSLVLTNNSGRGSITAMIPCSSTNAPAGTTCSAGNESIGVSFSIPQAIDVQACVSFSHNMVTGAGGTISSAFQLVETPNNAQTISQEGKSRVNPTLATASSQVSYPIRVCGTFGFSSAGQKTIRLMYEQSVTGSVTQSLILADADANNGQRDIHWEVYPILAY